MKRKIIQFAITGHENYLMALCDDGTLWEMGGLTKGKWAEILTVPQPGDRNE